MESIKDYDQTEDQDIESPAWHGEILKKRAEKLSVDDFIELAQFVEKHST